MYGYKEKKAAQVAAFFALKEGGSINVLKLAKLLYLAERESMSRYDEPMFFDRLVSMDHGPVTSISLNHANGLSESSEWSEFIDGRKNKNVFATEGASESKLDALSRADIGILNDLWGQFGKMSGFELRDWTHEHCLEWEDPNGSSNPINHERIYKFLGKENATELAGDISRYRVVSNALEA